MALATPPGLTLHPAALARVARVNTTTGPGVRIILASASPARRRVLHAAGVDPIVQVSGVDEDAITASLAPGTPPEQVVGVLAEAKARSVLAARADAEPDVVVVGCDSMLLFDGRLLGKPHTPELAAAQWREMRGRSAQLLTGHHLIRRRDGHDDLSAGETSTTTIHFVDAPDDAIDAYVATGEPLEVAGAFTLDGYGGWLIDRIEGDPSSVIGIGLPLVRRLLEQVGVRLTDLWQTPSA